MAETIVQGCDGFAKWHWYNIVDDLETQGGLEKRSVMINPLSVEAHGCAGEYREIPFYITWVHEKFLLLTMKEYLEELMEAFGRVVEYQPFCHYKKNGMVTVEWDKEDPDGRFVELQGEEELIRL